MCTYRPVVPLIPWPNNLLVLRSGAAIPQPERMIDAFFAEEWPYYDGIDDSDPNRIQPVDIVATLGHPAQRRAFW
jgi:hypothetical protein